MTCPNCHKDYGIWPREWGKFCSLGCLIAYPYKKLEAKGAANE